jgi:AraC-like DNA-binding protein
MTDMVDPVEQALDYIHGHLGKPLTLARVARHIGYSRNHLLILFRRQTGTTPGIYAANLRFAVAPVLLLRRRDWTIEQVASELGYTRSHFERSFKDRYGVPPGQYRTAHDHHPAEIVQQVSARFRLTGPPAGGVFRLRDRPPDVNCR